MNVAVTQCVGVVLRAPSRVGSWLTPLLPNEPRILNPDTQAALTARYLLPVSPELEACLRAVRRQLDPELERQQPTKLGKPYPLGQCLEIAEAVQKRLRTVVKESLSPDAAAGLCALQAFQRAGGDFRQVWGDLRGQYFQNAFQVGTLYIDVANDTVIPTKPKVEILPFDQAQFIPVRSHRHFSQIARSYWQHDIDFLQRTLVDHQLLSITVQGIPAPGYAFEDDKDPGDIPGFVAMIRAVNDCLRAKTLAAGFNFLDVHAATVGEDGQGNGRWHLDGYHLSPAFYRQAQDWLRLPN